MRHHVTAISQGRTVDFGNSLICPKLAPRERITSAILFFRGISQRVQILQSTAARYHARNLKAHSRLTSARYCEHSLTTKRMPMSTRRVLMALGAAVCLAATCPAIAEESELEVEASEAMAEWQKVIGYIEKFLDLRDAYQSPPLH